MSEGWRGVYLKAGRQVVAGAITDLAETRGYSVVLDIDITDLLRLERIWDIGLTGRGDTLEIFFLLTVNSEWTRIIGFSFHEIAYPRLFNVSELVMLLGCDAFECGFVERIAWWYSYYEKGLIADRFDSAPEEILHSLRDQIWGPDDPRLIYAKCLDIERLRDLQSLPWQVISQLRGHPEKLAPILQPQKAVEIHDVYKEEVPARAIERLAEVVALPYIGEFDVGTFLDDYASARVRFEATPAELLKYIEFGLSIVVLHHPKYYLLYNIA